MVKESLGVICHEQINPTFPKSSFSIGNSRDRILRDLENASEPDLSEGLYQLPESSRRFIPRGLLLNILDKRVVAEHLNTLLDDLQLLDNLTDYISPESKACHCKNGICTGSRILLASLMRIGRELLIVDFHNQENPRLCDSSLPFSDQNRLPEALNDLTNKEKQLFRHAQWGIRCHYLKKLGPKDDNPRELDNEAALPFLPVDEGGNLINGELSIVRHIRIDHEHHNLDEYSNHFALKTFKKNPRRYFENLFQEEFTAYQQAPQHNRIVPVLTAFKHRERFHFIFPLATGGNLEQLWKAFSARNTSWYSTQWLLGECLGLSEGLAATHQPTTIIELGMQHHPVPQIHGDIKPRNILCFETAKGEWKTYTLKLADFGFARKVDTDCTLKIKGFVTHTKTYRPPEYDVEDYVHLNYDIWCLGCVYLEFITWAVLGWPEIENFTRNRLEECDHPQISLGMGKCLEDTFFKKVVHTPRWYDLSALKLGTDRNIKITSKKTMIYQRIFRISRGTIQVSCEVKSSVTMHIERIRKHQTCTPEIRKFLDFIEKRMLVTNPTARANSSDVETFLRSIINR